MGSEAVREIENAKLKVQNKGQGADATNKFIKERN